MNEQEENLYMKQETNSGPITANPAVSGPNSAKDVVNQRFPHKGKQECDRENREREKCTIKLTTHEKDFLWDVWHYATSGITERYRRIGFSFRRGNCIKNNLLGKDLIVVTPVVFLIFVRG